MLACMTLWSAAGAPRESHSKNWERQKCCNEKHKASVTPLWYSSGMALTHSLNTRLRQPHTNYCSLGHPRRVPPAFKRGGGGGG
ncbi:unnamed protein product [Prorocentrum cordatum]|uniref:Secreted protein n=1 Tax=Prorocentrum cordatum TaxID=2364126 RepID=A0ABN9ULQ2_9DINO|nr:unnamed protein product [Polarella glacialis]